MLTRRLTTVLGRKVVFLSSVGLLALGDLLCSFAKTGPQLYAFRGISGVGNGGITALAMMIVSDIVTLENRGKYQGILGSCVGLGNTIGPFLAAAFIQTSTWRALFWCICPLAMVAGGLVAFTLPPSRVHGDLKTKVKIIDHYGVILSSSAVMLLLIPISGGGTYFEWNNSMVISMITVGGICMILFVFVEWKVALMPMMPLHLFKIPAVCAILIQNLLFGIVYYSHLYYLPIYYENARQFSPLLSAILTIPFVASQSVFSILSGQYISRTKRYGEIIWSGYALWTLGCGLILLFNRNTPRWQIVILLIIEGAGVGNVFQPTLVATQAHSLKRDRAVVISTRNFLRALGGSLGLALSSAYVLEEKSHFYSEYFYNFLLRQCPTSPGTICIEQLLTPRRSSVFSNVLSNSLDSLSVPLPESMKSSILASILRVPDLSSLTTAQRNEVLDSYMKASKGVFYVWVPLMGLCLALCLLIKDLGLTRPEEKPQLPEASGSETGDAVESDVKMQTLGQPKS
jgi:MFS family permease